ncbi:MAG: hypothetical protein CM15mP12_2650 [Gammaproteobacteria bacterium]|nr:MAG: hypothetical protein CM15mP12_2650 [Gammaproteobacteria bacterium]
MLFIKKKTYFKNKNQKNEKDYKIIKEGKKIKGQLKTQMIGAFVEGDWVAFYITFTF